MRFSVLSRRLAGLVALVLGVACGWSATRAQSTTLRLVSTAWPPFTNQAGQPRFALDLVEAALGRIGITSTTTIVDASKFTPALLQGDFDGSAAAWRNAERERVLLFSQPYLENRLILVGRKGADVSAKTFSALAGKRVAIVEGYAYGEGVETAGPVFVRAASEEDSVARLLKGSVDYVLMDDLVVQYIVEHHAKEAQAKLQLGLAPLLVRPLYFAVRRSRPDAQAIIDRFNLQLRSMITDRTYHRLLHVDWIRADVDGDGLLEYIPSSDRAGAAAPQKAYSLFSAPPSATLDLPSPKTTPADLGPRFYLGGNIYEEWASVPDVYKLTGSTYHNPGQSTGTLFRFAW